MVRNEELSPDTVRKLRDFMDCPRVITDLRVPKGFESARMNNRLNRSRGDQLPVPEAVYVRSQGQTGRPPRRPDIEAPRGTNDDGLDLNLGSDLDS